MTKFRVACASTAASAVVVPLMAVVAAPPASAALGEYCGLAGSAGLTTWVWTGAADDSLWNSAGNWEIDGVTPGAAPNLVDASDGYVCIDAAHDEDLDSDTVYIVHEDENLTPGNSTAISSMLQAIDISSGTLSINRAGKLYLYGDPVTRPSFVREDATIELTMGTLGGSGRIELAGDMVMTAAQRGPATLKSSCRGIAGDGPGDPPAGPDTLPAFCPPAADPATGTGRLVVSGSLTVRGGVLDGAGNLTDDGNARGVNLNQRYGIVVASGGVVTVLDDAYVAESHTASIEVQDGGQWTFEGNGDVIEGSFEGTPSGPLPPFVNDGIVTKATGAGASSIDTAYSGNGEVVVEDGAGSLTTPGGFPTEVAVASSQAVGTWDCPQVEFGQPASDCLFDNPANKALTSADDLQAAQLRQPELIAPDALVSVRETTTKSPEDLLPPIEITSSGVPRDQQSELDIEFSDKITALPPKSRVRIYRRAGAANWQEVPRCKDDPQSPLPNGVTACVRGNPKDRQGGEAIVFQMFATDPVGEWVLRDARRTVVPRENGTLPADDPDGPSSLILPVSTDDHCGPASSVGWKFRRTLVDERTDDHAVGWWPTGSGGARGLDLPVGDLADLDAAAARISVEGELRGYVRVVRRESATVSWVAVRPVVAADTEEVDDGWLLVQAGSFTYTWLRHVNGVPDATGPYVGTIADFVASHPGRAAGADPDTVGFAFGCAGERVLFNDVILRSDDEAVPPVWDLEVPQASIRMSKELQDIGAYCQVSLPTWPNRVTRRVSAPKGAKWDLQWRPAGPGETWRNLRAKAYVGGGSHEFRLPQQRGLLQAVLRPSGQYRIDGSGVLRFKAVPKVELGSITRSTKQKTLRVGHVVKVRGRSAPGGRVRLWTTGRNGNELKPTGATARVRNGRFSLSYKPATAGRYAFAVELEGTDRVNGALSRVAFFTKVEPLPPPPQQEPAPSPSLPPPSDRAPVYPPVILGRPVVGRAVPTECVFKVRR